MQTQDISADDSLGEEQIVTEKELEKQFMHPGYIFKGYELRPYGEGTETLFQQILDQNDAPNTIFVQFIFIHLPEHYEKNEKGEIVPKREFLVLCWDKHAFHAEVFIWQEKLGHLTREDKNEAMRLFEEMRGWARKSSVEVLPDPDRSQKKTRKATRQRRSHG